MRFTDQLNNTFDLPSHPKRIISIVPSQTELLWDLGIKEELLGITKFCIHPKEVFETKTRIGGTKQLNIEKIRALKPDVIIGNKEENEQSQIEALQKEFNVWMSDIYTLEDALESILKIGELVDRKEKAQGIAQQIKTSFNDIPYFNKSVLYLIWKNPYMASGHATFIGDVLKKLGLRNIFENPDGRYPEVSLDEIKHLNPELIFLSSEPFPFKDVHIQELQQILPQTKILLVDGELFSWYGSRLLKSVDYFKSLSNKLL